MLRAPRPARQVRRRRTAGALVIAGMLLSQACSAGKDAEADAVGAGPTSHTLTSQWDNLEPGSPIGYDARSHTVLAWAHVDDSNPRSPRRIVAYDIRTGKPKWANAPQGWDVNIDYVGGDRMSADAVIVQSNHQYQPPAVAALRLDDGKVLWQLPTPGHARATAVAADVVVMVWTPTAIRAVSAADGRNVWETKVEAGCRADEVAADEDLIAVDVVCEKKRRIESLDPDSGRSLWQQAVPPEFGLTAGNLSVHGDAVVAANTDQFMIMNRSGQVVLDEKSRNLGGRRFAAHGDVVVAAFHDGTGKPTLTAVDLRTGTPRWRRQLDVGSLAFFGPKLYAIGRPTAPLPQLALYSIDPATGQAAHSLTSLLGPAEYDTLVAVDQDMVVSYQFVGPVQHLWGHRLDPPPGEVGFAGGASADAWPDSCALLHTDELAAMASGAAYQARPQQTAVLDTILPRPALCRYQPSTAAAPTVSAAVAWVGRDEGQSVQLMAGLRAKVEARPVQGVGDEAVQTVQFGEPTSKIELYFRVGRCVGSVSILGDAATALELARLAAPRLCRPNGS